MILAMSLCIYHLLRWVIFLLYLIWWELFCYYHEAMLKLRECFFSNY
jgi:hypothetical protein